MTMTTSNEPRASEIFKADMDSIFSEHDGYEAICIAGVRMARQLKHHAYDCSLFLDRIKPSTEKPHCCFLGCQNKAEWTLWYGETPDDFTQSCTKHLGEMMTDAPETRVCPACNDKVAS